VTRRRCGARGQRGPCPQQGEPAGGAGGRRRRCKPAARGAGPAQRGAGQARGGATGVLGPAGAPLPRCRLRRAPASRAASTRPRSRPHRAAAGARERRRDGYHRPARWRRLPSRTPQVSGPRWVAPRATCCFLRAVSPWLLHASGAPPRDEADTERRDGKASTSTGADTPAGARVRGFWRTTTAHAAACGGDMPPCCTWRSSAPSRRTRGSRVHRADAPRHVAPTSTPCRRALRQVLEVARPWLTNCCHSIPGGPKTSGPPA